MTATKNAGALAALVALLACEAACQKSSQSVTPPPAAPQKTAQPVAAEPAPERATIDAGNPVASCVDAWLAQRKLDPYGNAEGTLYAGGTPLFNEQTGETTDRLAYVFAKHPDAKAACAPDAGADSGAKPGGLPTR